MAAMPHMGDYGTTGLRDYRTTRSHEQCVLEVLFSCGPVVLWSGGPVVSTWRQAAALGQWPVFFGRPYFEFDAGRGNGLCRADQSCMFFLLRDTDLPWR